jgi:phospholipid/glycerol acyltransferase
MITWPADMLRFARSGFGYGHRRPEGAPEPTVRRRDRLGRSDLSEIPNLLHPLTWRLEYRVAGLDALEGLEGPVVFAVNGQGVLDWQVLKAVLPPRLRTRNHNPSGALTRGRSVALFSDPSTIDGGVGEFSTEAAELAKLHGIPVVPVAMLGTFKLNEVLRLALKRRPRIFVRFGAPVYVRGKTLERTTSELQAAVGALFHTGALSWWAVQNPAPPPVTEPMPRWRRLWQQTTPREPSAGRIWVQER